jgi:D-alanyl-D-alanine carboxypeptidase
LLIASAYRSNDFQAYMIKKWCSRARCAQAGTSEHQWGFAVDLKVIARWWKWYALNSGNRYYQWFADNAHKRGFHNSYQKWIDVDGQMVEWRHRRYMWTGLATELHDKGMTFAEYMKSGLGVAERGSSDVDSIQF